MIESNSLKFIFFAAFFAVVLSTFAVFMNLNESGTAVSGAAYTYGSAVKLQYGIPSGHILDNPNRNDFEKNTKHCFKKYSDNSLIDDNHKQGPGWNNPEICVQTGGKENAGTDADIKYWVDGKQECLYSDGTKKSPDWYISWVLTCHYASGSSVARCDPAVDLGVWIRDRAPNNIVCW